MATESVNASVNGSYGSQQSYGSVETSTAVHPSGPAGNATNGADSGQPVTAAAASGTSGAAESNGNVSKDEVGWYFVEQYYTTLSRNPEKLHLFYSKRSQFVSGVEAEKVSVSVGQRAISERIKEMDIQDCKVRVSNVDSQESFKNIVVQVIGEMSNKAAPHRKFVQTFVLAEQPNGYFVLNDIFRYINEEEDDEVEDQTVTDTEHLDSPVPETEGKTLTGTDDKAAQQQDVELLGKKIEENIPEGKTEEPLESTKSSNGKASSDVGMEEEATADTGNVHEEDTHTVVEEAQPTTEVEAMPVEKPKDPEPTPVATPPKSAAATATPEPVSMPTSAPKPATWAFVASRVSSAPAPSNISVAPSQSSTQTKPPQPAAAPVLALSTPSSDDTTSQALPSPGAGWQTAGQDNVKRQARQQSNSVSGGAGEKGNILGYVKNVTEKVDAAELRNTLNQYGKLEYFDVSRQKNCAFVEFADIAGYNAAVAANPHLIGGEQIFVEERRPRPTAYGGGFNGRGGMRGGRGGPDGRTPSQGRGGFQKDGGRGGFVPRGRGGSLTPRGRGMPQAA